MFKKEGFREISIGTLNHAISVKSTNDHDDLEGIASMVLTLFDRLRKKDKYDR